MSIIKLMVVDDQELIRESISFVLNTDEEIDVIGIAGNGEEAIQLCRTNKPDVILMDIQMPIMDGISATKTIKKQWPECKIIILTTFQDIDHVVEALSIGAEGYLLKAIHPKDLISGIKLIYKGGTLLPQDLAKLLFQQIQPPSEPSKPVPRYDLTEREIQILECLSLGLNNKAIAERVFLSEGTVKNYISSIYHKLDVKDRFEAAFKAKEEELF